MKTKITELLGIEYPVIQGGMAWVAESSLAVRRRRPWTDRGCRSPCRVGKRADQKGERND